MHLGLDAVLAGLGVGLVVGVTGSGGGALLTPVLILLLGVNAKTAVSSDLVATLVMRPVAGAVHLGRHTVHWPLVGWLAAGSVPAAFLAGWGSRTLVPASQSATVLSPVIGVALLLSGGVAIARRLRRHRRRPAGGAEPSAALGVRPLATFAVGVVGGAIVGITSVGSGTLMLVAMGALYPELGPAELVGTDLIQAVPLVGAAALGHLVGGGLHLSLTAAVVAGGVPGALVGALASRYVPARPLGAVVAAVIFGSGCALIGWGPGGIVGGLALAAAAIARYRLRERRADPAAAPAGADVVGGRPG
ncbi:MAG TPA: sulfite exporter TauE/SafE family protein [Acidimicrobiales bacterium]|nr:sulfite exporter TauE/SafE family protein [Acidimicrobiales bacterium]